MCYIHTRIYAYIYTKGNIDFIEKERETGTELKNKKYIKNNKKLKRQTNIERGERRPL